MRIKLKKNPKGITGVPNVYSSLSAQASLGQAMVNLHLRAYSLADTRRIIVASLRLSPSEAREIATELTASADTADRLLAGRTDD